MIKKRDKPRYFVAKPQKGTQIIYYWEPSKKLQANGFLRRRLSDDREKAIQQASEFNRELDEWRRQLVSAPQLSANPTVSEIIELYKKDPAFTETADTTQRVYGQCLKRIEQWSGDIPIASIPRTSIIEFHREIYGKTPAFANAIARVMRILFGFACNHGVVDSNNAAAIKLRSRPPRKQVWKDEDITAFIKAAELKGFPSMALAVLLGACTAQRQADILALTWHQYDNRAIRLKQNKTNRWVIIPAMPELKVELDHAKQRAQKPPTKKNAEFIVLCETTHKKYEPDHFRHLFREIADSAGLNDLQYRDLRRTAIVRFAEAGLSTGLITAISGHDVGHTERILEVYMPRTVEMAEEAIRRYVEFRDKQKSKETKEKDVFQPQEPATDDPSDEPEQT